MAEKARIRSAMFMLLAGVVLSFAGFCVEPLGHISDSVLWFFAQCLLYAGAALGIDALVEHKFKKWTENGNETSKGDKE